MTQQRTIATSRPIRLRDSRTYLCRWCGIERTRGGNNTRTNAVCDDCKPTERAFGGK